MKKNLVLALLISLSSLIINPALAASGTSAGALPDNTTDKLDSASTTTPLDTPTQQEDTTK